MNERAADISRVLVASAWLDRWADITVRAIALADLLDAAPAPPDHPANIPLGIEPTVRRRTVIVAAGIVAVVGIGVLAVAGHRDLGPAAPPHHPPASCADRCRGPQFGARVVSAR